MMDWKVLLNKSGSPIGQLHMKPVRLEENRFTGTENRPGSCTSCIACRWYYHTSDEIEKNRANAEAAIERLEATPYQGTDQSKNSAWSKMWLLREQVNHGRYIRTKSQDNL